MINPVARSVEDVILGDKAVDITDVLGNSQGRTCRAVLGFQIWQAESITNTGEDETSNSAGLSLLVCDYDVRFGICLG